MASQSKKSPDGGEPVRSSDGVCLSYRYEVLSCHESVGSSSDDDSEEAPQSRMAKVPQDTEEVEQEMKTNPHDESGRDDALLLTPMVPFAESSTESILEQQTVVKELGPADPNPSADVADRHQQDGVECLKSDRGEPGDPSDAEGAENEWEGVVNR